MNLFIYIHIIVLYYINIIQYEFVVLLFYSYNLVATVGQKNDKI